MGMKQILKAKNLIVTVPDSRKAQAVFNSCTQDINVYCPGTYLQTHPSCVLFCDEASAALL